MVPRGWAIPLIWASLGFLLFLSGLASNNVVTMVIGVSLGLAGVSASLTAFAKCERRVEKAVEAVAAFGAMVLIVYGYAITGSLILGVLTLFIAAMLVLAFAASYLIPRIRSQSAAKTRREA
ncbi:MAG: hypothetical protein QW057_10530 [Candidatus Bathyarchaeia archaeon]